MFYLKPISLIYIISLLGFSSLAYHLEDYQVAIYLEVATLVIGIIICITTAHRITVTRGVIESVIRKCYLTVGKLDKNFPVCRFNTLTEGSQDKLQRYYHQYYFLIDQLTARHYYQRVPSIRVDDLIKQLQIGSPLYGIDRQEHLSLVEAEEVYRFKSIINDLKTLKDVGVYSI